MESAAAAVLVQRVLHLTAANEHLVDALFEFTDSPAVLQELSMSAEEVQRWTRRFQEASEACLEETTLSCVVTYDSCRHQSLRP